MKNSKLKVALFAASVLTSFGNVKAQTGFQIGVEGTPQVSYLVNRSDIESSLYRTRNAINGSFGISSQLNFTKIVGLGVNVLYSFQGDKYEWKDVERYKQLQYIQVPIMLTLDFPVGTNMVYFAKIGPQIDFLTDAKLLNKSGGVIRSNYRAAFQDYGLSAVLSSGIGYNIGDFCIDLAIRYGIGLTNAENKDFKPNIHDPFDYVTPVPSTSPRENTHNMTVGMTVGVRYRIM